MSIDTMLKVADENGQGTYVVSNEQNSPVFVNIDLAKISVKDGKLVKDYYNKDNLLTWEVTTTQNKLILEPGMRKMIGIRALCAEACDPDNDGVYAVQFSPTPYNKEGKPKKGVSVSYGYESVFIIPAKNKRLSYSIVKKDAVVNLKNNSNTTLKVFLNQCSALYKSDCSIKTILLPGKVRSLKLPKNARKGDINTFITTVDNDFYKKEVLSNGKEIKFTKNINK